MKVKERHLQPRAAKKFFQMKMQSGGDKQREGDNTLKSTDMGHLENAAIILSAVGMDRSLSLMIGEFEGIVLASRSGLWT